MRNKQVEFNPYIYTLSKLYRFGYEISFFLIQNTWSLFYGRHYSSLHRLMSLHGKIDVNIFLMFFVAEHTGSVNIYNYVWSNPNEVEKAAIKARLLTGTYTLQVNRHRFNQYEVEKTCKLCNKETEDRQHFILHCSVLEHGRNKHMSKLLEIALGLTGKNTNNCYSASWIAHMKTWSSIYQEQNQQNKSWK